MRNAIVMTALAAGLAFGTAQASFAQGQVDGGAAKASGQPTTAQQGAGTAMGKTSTGSGGSMTKGMKKKKKKMR